MFRAESAFLVLLTLLLIAAGCRRAAPPSFSPGVEVEKLTEDVDDPEELAELKLLQTQVMDLLQQHTGTPDKLFMLGEPADERKPLLLGYAIYSQYCTQCHGVNGDGNGQAAEYLQPKPRNYKRGIFKFTSTPYGSKPRRSDLIHTLRRGVTGTSMPSFDRFNEEQLNAVVDYVIALSLRGELETELARIVYDEEELPGEDVVAEIIDEKRQAWKDSAYEVVMPVTPMPEDTPETVLAGHRLFLEYACNKCHGKYGRGGSMEKVEVGSDVWGNKAAAADLSSGMFRGGGRPVDIYRRIYSGINGTPMPAFKKTFENNPDAIWNLVQFILETGQRRREGKPPLSEADLPTAEPAPTENPAEQTEPAEPPGAAA